MSALPAPLETAPLPAPVTPRICSNCGAAFATLYCGSCGQRDEPHVHSIGHFFHEAFESLSHADSRLWLTLRLLLTRPGYLTRQFFEGKRLKYLPPFRLYLVISVLFFVTIGLWAGDGAEVQGFNVNGSQAAQQATRDLQRDLGNSGLNEPWRKAIDEALENANSPAPIPNETAQQRAERLCKNQRVDEGSWLSQLARQACVNTTVDNGASVGRAFFANVPRAMFVFLPLLAFAMMLMYWRPRRYYVEHLLFLVHNHAFVFLVLFLYGMFTLLPLQHAVTATIFIATPLWFFWRELRLRRRDANRKVPWVKYGIAVFFCVPFGWEMRQNDEAAAAGMGTALFIYMAWYFYRGMREMYGQGRGLTVAKFTALGFVYLVLSTLVLAMTGLFSAALA